MKWSGCLTSKFEATTRNPIAPTISITIIATIMMYMVLLTAALASKSSHATSMKMIY